MVAFKAADRRQAAKAFTLPAFRNQLGLKHPIL